MHGGNGANPETTKIKIELFYNFAQIDLYENYLTCNIDLLVAENLRHEHRIHLLKNRKTKLKCIRILRTNHLDLIKKRKLTLIRIIGTDARL